MDRFADFADGFEAGQRGGEKDIRAGIFICLQSCDRVGQIGVAAKEVFGASREGEREGEGARRLNCGGDPVGGLGAVKQRAVRVAGEVFD